MIDGLQRQSVALALLAVLVGAIVQITQSTGLFTPWETIVGLIMLMTARAYDKAIDRIWNAEAIAFAMIVAIGIVFTVGVVLDQILLKAGVTWWDSPAEEKLRSVRGFISQSLHDDIYFTVWLMLTAAVFYFRSRQRMTKV